MPREARREGVAVLDRTRELDEREIEIETAVNVGVDIMAPPGMEEMGQQLRSMFSQLAGGKTHRKTMAIRAARPLLIEEEAGRLVNEDEGIAAALPGWKDILERYVPEPFRALGTPL